jgi:SAM-dependent methyltransferase
VTPSLSLPPDDAPSRTDILQVFSHVRPVLEIGPFDRPMVTGDGVYYFDVLDQENLIKKAKTNPRRTGTVPFIHYVSPIGDMTIIDRTFAAVFSSHAIEHQPDLMKHLCDVGRILKPNGFYFLAIPDKRYCFDHFSAESSIADVIEARGRRVHSLGNIVTHRALFTHNDVRRHWAGDHANPAYRENMPNRIKTAIRVHEEANGSYVDVHAWRFTPRSFREIAQLLFEIEFSPLKPQRVYETPRLRGEFMAVLQKVR